MTLTLQPLAGLRSRWTREELLQHLHRLERTLGRSVRSRDVAAASRAGNAPGLKAYYTAFGGFTAAVVLLKHGGIR
jgi:hypothetical protein